MEEGLNLLQKLAKIREMSNVATKNKSGYNYKYTDITSILAQVSAGMKKYGVSLIPEITPGTTQVSQNVTRNTKVDKAGNTFENVSTEMLVFGEMTYTWVNDEDPSDYLKIPWFMTGSQGDPSQAMGSALSYTLRYFLINYFQIAQPLSDSDVDAYRSRQKEAEVSEEKEIASGIIQVFDEKLRAYLADNQDQKENVQKFITRYVKDPTKYKTIKEPKLAAKMLEDFSSKFLGEE